MKISSLAAHPSEGGINWLKQEPREGNPVYYGKELTVSRRGNHGKWVGFVELEYLHPAEKFALLNVRSDDQV